MTFDKYLGPRKKIARIALAVLSTIALIILTVLFLGANQRLKETEQDNRTLKYDNIQLESENEALRRQLDSLQKMVHALKDERDSLLAIIHKDKKAIRWYANEYRRLKKEETALNKRVNALQDSIAVFVESNQNKDAQIRAYEKEIRKAEAEQKNLVTGIKKANGAAEILRTKVAETEKKMETKDAEIRRNDLLLNTTVEVLAIDFRMNHSTSIKRDGQLENKWKYTDLHFAVSHPDSTMLKPGMLFAVELIDVTNGKALPVNEGTGETAIFLRLDDNGYLKGTFPQTEKKEGLSYRFQVSFVLDEENRAKRESLSQGSVYVVAHGKRLKKYVKL